MSTVKDITRLSKLVASTHGWAAAKAVKSYEMNEADGVVLSKCAVDLLKVFPPARGSSALMSAALAVALEGRLHAPVHVVAGSLAVEGIVVYGDETPFDAAKVLSADQPGWKGHVWVMIGACIVDIALFRMAYADQAPTVLSRHVHQAFGPGKALYVDLWKRTARMGLGYEPHHILSADEVTELMGAAYHVIKQARSS